MSSVSPVFLYELVLILASVLGIAIGSFLNVVIWRLPRGGNVNEPKRSYCPKCEHQLGVLDNIPILSYLFLGARCRYCKARISWRYPAIELLTGALFALVAVRFGCSWETLFYCVATAIWVAVFFIDLEHFVIPDGLNALCIVVGFAHNGVAIWAKESGQWSVAFGHRLPASLWGMLVYMGVTFCIGIFGQAFYVGIGAKKGVFRAVSAYVRESVADWLYLTVYYLGTIAPPLRRFVEPPEPLQSATMTEIEEDEDAGAMGGGDVKLAAGIGAVLYWPLSVLSFMMAVVVTIAAQLPNLLRLKGRTPVPFGPGMVAGAYLALLYGNQIGTGLLSWYLKTTGLESGPSVVLSSWVARACHIS